MFAWVVFKSRNTQVCLEALCSNQHGKTAPCYLCCFSFDSHNVNTTPPPQTADLTPFLTSIQFLFYKWQKARSVSHVV